MAASNRGCRLMELRHPADAYQDFPCSLWAMDLFASENEGNLLPCDGMAQYFGSILTDGEQTRYFETLLAEIPWESDEVVMFGKRIVTARKVAWYGDSEFAYRYSGSEKVALSWTPALKALKQRVEEWCGEAFNSCLLNLYHDGSEGMGWHSDDEPSLVTDSAIASLSLGVERKFSFKHRESKETVSLKLEKGSLLMMKGETQRYWRHALPKTKKVDSARINLTFRSFVA
jgi:alkylated DNA repair dioxygenase AlkB